MVSFVARHCSECIQYAKPGRIFQSIAFIPEWRYGIEGGSAAVFKSWNRQQELAPTLKPTLEIQGNPNVGATSRWRLSLLSTSMRLASFIAMLLLLGAATASAGTDQRKVLIDYFQQPGCPACEKISKLVLPQIEERFQGHYEMLIHDIGVKENFIKLMTYQESLGVSGNEPVCMIVDGRRALDGYTKIEAELAEAIDERISEMASNTAVALEAKPLDEQAALELRKQRMTLAALVAAAFVDGFNPCVFAGLVFLVSLLTTLRVGGGRLLAVGASYCLACFLCYLAIGFGLLRAIHMCAAYPSLRVGINVAMTALLLFFSVLSFRDAWRYRRGGKPGDILLRLPESLSAMVRKIMRHAVSSAFLFPGAFAAGFAVTAIESVCTGQVYAPALVLLAQEEGLRSRWLYCLLLYNAVFIIPLVLVFAAVYAGATLPTLLKWSRFDAFAGKIALGVFFLALAILLAWLTLPAMQLDIQRGKSMNSHSSVQQRR